MKKSDPVKTYRFHEEVIEWLQINVGPLQWSRPIIVWKGQGWRVRQQAEVMPRGTPTRAVYWVEIDNPQLETLFRLWA